MAISQGAINVITQSAFTVSQAEYIYQSVRQWNIWFMVIIVCIIIYGIYKFLRIFF